MLQSTALDILKSGVNVFLTGSAGTGKTYVINQYIQYLRERGVRVAITASTGIAATHIGGMTIHSWAGIGIREHITERDLSKISVRPGFKSRLSRTKVLVIDEISMLSGGTLNLVDQVLRHFQDPFLPFGGVQVIFSGDFFQLPPIVKNATTTANRFAFMAPIWVESELQICYLTEQFRQEDNSLTNTLEAMRSGDFEEEHFEPLQERYQLPQEDGEDRLRLFTHNADVDEYNYERFSKVTGSVSSYPCVSYGEPMLTKALKKSMLAPLTLELKVGVPIMFVKNNQEKGYFNGTLGVVTGFNSENLPIVETRDGQTISAHHDTWSIEDERGNVLASVSQLPLRLAWAITIHKSQGMTLDEAEIDLRRAFECGQGYVALSRVKSLNGLFLKGFNHQALQMDPLAMKADKRFKVLSNEGEKALQSQTPEELQDLHQDFIKHLGGTLDPQEILKNQEELKLKKDKKPVKKEKPVKISTIQITYQYVKELKTIEEISRERELSRPTIIKHIGELRALFPVSEFEHLRPEESDLKKIKLAIAKVEMSGKAERTASGKLVLTSVYNELKQAFSFDQLRLAMIFIQEDSKED